jgi:hypothetical protein
MTRLILWLCRQYPFFRPTAKIAFTRIIWLYDRRRIEAGQNESPGRMSGMSDRGKVGICNKTLRGHICSRQWSQQPTFLQQFSTFVVRSQLEPPLSPHPQRL